MHRARLASTGHGGQPQSQLARMTRHSRPPDARNNSKRASCEGSSLAFIYRVLDPSSSHLARQHHRLTLDKVCFTSNSYYNLATNITSTPAFHLMCASWIIPQIALLQIPRGLLGLGGAQHDRCRRCDQIYRYAVRIIPKVFAAFGLGVSTCGLWLSPRTNEAFSWRLFISLSEPQALMRSHVPIRSPRSLAISALSGFSDDATSFLANLPLQMSTSKVAGVCSRIPMKAPILSTGLHTNAFIRSALALP